MKRILVMILCLIIVLGSYSFTFASQGVLTNDLVLAGNTGNTCSLLFYTSSAVEGSYTVNINNYSNFSNCDTVIDISLNGKSKCSNITFTNIQQYNSSSDSYYIRGWDDIIPSASPASLSFTYNGGYTGEILFGISFSTQAVVPDNPFEYYGVEVFGPGGEPLPVGSYSLPCGNIIYLDLGSGFNYELDFTCTFRETAGALNSTFSNTFYYTFANSLPDSSSSFVPSVGTYIDMYKDMEKANIFGYTKAGYGSISGTTSGRYLVIVNPLHYGTTTNIYNTPLNISGIAPDTSVYVYPVSSSISGNEIMSTINSPVGGTGTVSPSGGAIDIYSTEDIDVIYIPNPGGNTVENSDENLIDGYLSGSKDILHKFFDNFIILFSKPISYIQSLISAGSNFINHLAGLWTWLPAEVSSIIQSAMIVTISVAVFKVFL